MADDAAPEEKPQRLVQVPKRRRLVPPASERLRADAAEPPRVHAPEEPEGGAPDLSIEDPAYHTPHDAVPPAVSDPAKRQKPTMGLIELTDAATGAARVVEVEDRSDGVLRTLEDIMGMFPIGDQTEQYFIRVERLKPLQYAGVATRGVLRPIKEALTLEGFIEQYGGGDYQLIVYGPPRQGGIEDVETGLIRPKALTKPVRFTIPYFGEGGYLPNPDAAFSSDSEDNDMRSNSHMPDAPSFVTARGVTPASAKMYDSHLGHQREMDNRDRADRRESTRQEQNVTMTALDIVRQEAAAREKLLLRQIEELKTQKGDRDRRPSDLEGMASVMKAVMPTGAQGDVQGIREQHSRELERIDTAHKHELDALRRTHAAELERIQRDARHGMELANTRVTTAEENARVRVSNIEEKLERDRTDAAQRIERREADLRAEYDRRFDQAEREHTRAMEAQKVHYEDRLKAEERQRGRDEELRRQTTDLQIASAKTPLDAKIITLESENSRLRAEVEKTRHELEQKGNLAKQIEVFGRTAEALGFEKPEGGSGGEAVPVDWKTQLAGIGMNLVQNLPQLLESASKAAATVRSGPAQQQLPGMPMSPMQQQYPVTTPAPIRQQGFATDDSGGAPPLQMDAFGPMPPPAVMPMAMPTPQQQMIVPVAPTAPAPAMQQQGPSPAQAMSPASPSVPPPAPAPQESAPPMPADASQAQVDGAVMSSREQIEQWLQSGANPSEIATGLVGQFGVAFVRSYLPTLTPEVVSSALVRNGQHASPLVKRKGQRFLGELHRALSEELRKREATGG